MREPAASFCPICRFSAGSQEESWCVFRRVARSWEGELMQKLIRQNVEGYRCGRSLPPRIQVLK